MLIQSGKHADKTTQEVLLREPDWVQFFLSKNSTGKVVQAFRRHIQDLDAKPFTKKCFRCPNAATRMSAYEGNAVSTMFWCATCDPYSLAANKGTLTIITTFAGAIRFVDLHCKGRRADKRVIIRDMARAKGLPTRITQQAATSFLP